MAQQAGEVAEGKARRQTPRRVASFARPPRGRGEQRVGLIGLLKAQRGSGGSSIACSTALHRASAPSGHRRLMAWRPTDRRANMSVSRPRPPPTLCSVHRRAPLVPPKQDASGDAARCAAIRSQKHMANACNMGGTATAPCALGRVIGRRLLRRRRLQLLLPFHQCHVLLHRLEQAASHWAAAPGASAGLVTMSRDAVDRAAATAAARSALPNRRPSRAPRLELTGAVEVCNAREHRWARRRAVGPYVGVGAREEGDEQRRPTARGASDDDGMIADAPRWRSNERRWCCQPRTKSSTPVGAPRPSSAPARPRVRIASAAATTASRDASDGHIARRKWKSEPTSDACASVAMCSSASAPAASALAGAKCVWSGMSWDGRRGTSRRAVLSSSPQRTPPHRPRRAAIRHLTARLSDSVARTPARPHPPLPLYHPCSTAPRCMARMTRCSARCRWPHPTVASTRQHHPGHACSRRPQTGVAVVGAAAAGRPRRLRRLSFRSVLAIVLAREACQERAHAGAL